MLEQSIHVGGKYRNMKLEYFNNKSLTLISPGKDSIAGDSFNSIGWMSQTTPNQHTISQLCTKKVLRHGNPLLQYWLLFLQG